MRVQGYIYIKEKSLGFEKKTKYIGKQEEYMNY